MNSLDYFAALRPAVDPISDERLDQLWRTVTERESSDGSSRDSTVGSTVDRESATGPNGGSPELDLLEDHRSRSAGGSRRRLAVLGAAAALMLGVVGAVVVVAGRADAPDPVNGRPTVSSPVEPADSARDPEPAAPLASAAVLGPEPAWMVDAPGWSEPNVTLSGPDDAAVVSGLRFFVHPDSPEEAWILVYPSAETSVVPATAPPLGAPPAVTTTQTVEHDGAFFGVNAGGIGDAAAADIVAAAQSGVPIPFGFVEIDPAELGSVVNFSRIEFDGPDGMGIMVEIEGGGMPNYTATTMSFTTGPDRVRPGVDEAVVQSIGGDFSVVARTGFWVSRISVTSLGSGSMTSEELVALVALQGELPAVPDVEVLALGDSVMLGAAMDLVELGVVIDAEESRSFRGGLDVVRPLAEQDRLPGALVMHLGNNGPISPAGMDEFIELVAGVDTVVLLTNAIDRDYTPSNNELILVAAAERQNIEVLDWGALAGACPGDCFESDGFHLKLDGRAYYAELMATELRLDIDR